MADVLWKQFFQYQQDRYSFSMLSDLVTLAEEEDSFCMLGCAWAWERSGGWCWCVWNSAGGCLGSVSILQLHRHQLATPE